MYCNSRQILGCRVAASPSTITLVIRRIGVLTAALQSSEINQSSKW